MNVSVVQRGVEDNLRLKHQFPTGQAIAAPLSYLPPNPKVAADTGTIFAASSDGFVYALLERSGELLWRFSVGEPTVEQVAVIENRVYIPTELGGMFCLNAKSGRQDGGSPNVLRFLAASKQRVFASDKLGRVRILDAKTGAALDTLPTELLPVKLTNTRTDRLYLGTETGLIECLHDLEQTKPIRYDLASKLPSDELPPNAKPQPAAKEPGEKPKPSKPKPPPPPSPRPRPSPTMRIPSGRTPGPGRTSRPRRRPRRRRKRPLPAPQGRKPGPTPRRRQQQRPLIRWRNRSYLAPGDSPPATAYLAPGDSPPVTAYLAPGDSPGANPSYGVVVGLGPVLAGAKARGPGAAGCFLAKVDVVENPRGPRLSEFAGKTIL